MSYYLLENPNPNGRHYYPSRRTCKHGVPPSQLPHLIVIHTAESRPDIKGEDTGAEGISRYVSTTSREVSWHASIDSDSTIDVLPDDHVAWHVRGYNTCSIGVEIATQAHKWGELPEWWKTRIYRNVREWVAEKAAEHGIPLELINEHRAAQGGRGVIGHRHLDPSRRTDPGAGFEWDRILTNNDNEEEQMLSNGDAGNAVKVFQQALMAWKPEALPVYKADGDFGDETEEWVRNYQRAAEIQETGAIDGVTAALLSRYVAKVRGDGGAHEHPFAPAVHAHDVLGRLVVTSKSDTATIAKAVAGELKVEGNLSTGPAGS